MKKKYKIISIVVTVFLLIILVIRINVYFKNKQQNTQYPYSEITKKNNLYYHKNILLTGKSYIIDNNSDSVSFTITKGLLIFKRTYKNGTKVLIEEFYQNGTISSKSTFQNNKLNGLYESYNSNGTLFIKTMYKDDKKDGIEEVYHDNGTINTKRVYKDDKKNGLDESYSENGVLKYRTMYLDDKKNGLDEIYYDNGNIMSKTIYKDDKKNGIYEFYNDKGELQITTEYLNDKEVKKEKEVSNNTNQSNLEGVYIFETGYRRMKITITPEKWFGWLEDGSGDGNYSGKTIIGGKINGSDLYDENGIEKRGYVSGSTIYYNDPLGEIKLSRR
jgi:antitoxin component YwqK of YwqJK toxin-antitoxin module